MSSTNNRLIFILLAFLLIVLLGWNNILELRAEEPRRAIVSLEMLLSGNYLSPNIHGWAYYNKPPLFNWIMAVCFRIFGNADEWVVRLPSLISLLGIGYLNYVVVKKYFNYSVALLSSLIFITGGDILFYGSVNAGEIDLFYALLVYGQVMSLFYFLDLKKILAAFLISYVLAALGVLTKGPPSIAFQVLTILPWLIVQRKLKLLLCWQHLVGVASFIIIVVGYFALYGKYNDAIGYAINLFKEASQRTGLEYSLEDTLLSVMVFPFYVIKLTIPWSFFAILFIRKDLIKIIRNEKLLLFAAIFILFNIPVYWFAADFKARYLYMFFPFFSILLAYFICTQANLGKWKSRIVSLLGYIIIVLSLIFFAMPFLEATSTVPAILWKSIFLGLGGCGIWIAFHKWHDYRLYIFVGFLLLIRLGFNIIYLPALIEKSTSLVYKEHVTNILEITKNAPVHWTGDVLELERDASLGPLTFAKVKLTTPPLLPYQVPYYLTRENGFIMQYDSIPREGIFYLLYKSSVKSTSQDILYSFHDRWMKDELLLIQYK